MYNDIIVANLSAIEEVELVYCENIKENDTIVRRYNIVIENNNIVSNIETLRRIISTMEVIKETIKKINGTFVYKIKSAEDMEESIKENNDNFNKRFKKSEIIYAKDDYYDVLVRNSKVRAK